MLYEKPVWQLMAGVVDELKPPLAPKDIRDWFAAHYPLVKASTVTANIVGLTANDQNRRFYSVSVRRPLFFKTADGSLVFYDPAVHGTFDASGTPSSASGGVAASVADAVDEDEDADATMEFALETYLEEFLLTNWATIDWGRRLRLYEAGQGGNGHQFATPVGRLDFLCVDEDTGALVVVELKRGRPSDQAIGQIARYIGWVRTHIADEQQQVDGILVTKETDARLAYAASAMPGLEIMEYWVNFALKPHRLTDRLGDTT